MRDILAYDIRDMKVKVKTTKGNHDSELDPFAEVLFRSLAKLKWDLKMEGSYV